MNDTESNAKGLTVGLDYEKMWDLLAEELDVEMQRAEYYGKRWKRANKLRERMHQVELMSTMKMVKVTP